MTSSHTASESPGTCPANGRSQKGYVTESQMSRLVRCWFPRPLICHPYPEQRIAVMIQGKSPVR